MQASTTKTQTAEPVVEILKLISQLASEVHQHKFPVKEVTLDSHFEKDLGLDSLSRTELIARVEQKFELALPEKTFSEAQSARDLLRAIQGVTTSRESLSDLDIQKVVLAESHDTPEDSRTLVDVLNWHVQTHPERPHIQMYTDRGDGETITYRQLRDSAMRIAGGLQERGLKPAEPVALMLPTGPDYFHCFFGVLLAGGIPVPVYPPTRASQLEDHMRRHVHILNNCLAKTFITVTEAKNVATLLKSQVTSLQHIVSADDLAQSEAINLPPVLSANDIAFLQYTSGSTGDPKGVVLTHANLLANIRAMGKAVRADSKDVFVSWLPLYHDMGLIGAWLGSLYFAALFVVMSPLSFLARPERWLWAIHHYHGTLSASPNFGYEYCYRRLRDEDIQGLNLSSWRAAFNGAETVSAKTISNFSQRFDVCGFNERAMMPVYGLAESTVGLTFPPLLRGTVVDCINRDKFMQSGVAEKTKDDDPHGLRFVSSGLPLHHHEIRVIDSTGHELPERHEGRLEFHGPSSSSGYYRDTEKTQNLFDGDWLDTGDLGYIANGELFITGRIKDIIIRAGRNIYPHELEEAIGDVAGIRNGRVAVFGSEDPQSKTERLVVIAEIRSTDNVEREKLHTEINALAIDLIGSPPDEIVLAPPGTVLKTSSGKIRRAACRKIYEKGEIGKAQASVYLQISRIALASILPQLRRLWRHSKTITYAIYCWLIYCLLALFVWLATMFLPGFGLRWFIAKNSAALLGKLTATRVTVNGIENIPADGSPYVLVSNHASYLDSYALIATLPGHIRFTAKKELGQYFFNRIPLKNIRTEFIDRYDTGKSLADAHRLSNILKQGNSLMFFAEGTFTRAPGLRPFHLGAFTIAAEANAPIIPVAIRGTRSMLRSGSWFPHHGSIHIDIGTAIEPKTISDEAQKDTWHTAIELRNRSRKFILRHCGEPDLTEKNT